jgi:hypothetical protein
MTAFHYVSGEEIREGDHVRYRGKNAFIEFVLVEPTGEPLIDMFLADHPEGGVGLRIPGWSEFLLKAEINADLEFVSRDGEC